MKLMSLMRKIKKSLKMLSKNISTANKASISDFKRNGKLIQSNGDVFGSKVFYIKDKYRYYVPDVHWINSQGFSFPNDIQIVSDDFLNSFASGGSVIDLYSLEDYMNPPRDSSVKMRSIIVSQLNGSGIEVGAGASPFSVPLHCHVRYVDKLSSESLQNELYPGQKLEDLVKPDIVSDLEKLDGIEDSSLDFIIACHVIEHTKNPLMALKTAYQKLRYGGSLVLVIPDKERTFDKDRELTTLDHLILDYSNPSENRDKEHYEEFYTVAFKVPVAEFNQTVEEKINEDYLIHFHTWIYESFSKMIDYSTNNICPWAIAWSQPTLSNKQEDIEFYFVLTK